MMKSKAKYQLLFLSACFLFQLSCNKTDPEIPSAEDDIVLVIPEGFPPPVYDFQFNPLTREGFELGRKLFYDPILSKDNSISCASCHQQFAAFSHLEHPLSHGIYGLLGTRNTPGMFNLIWQQDLMWDGGVHNLEIQPLAPITNPVEMDETLAGVLAKLNAHPVYPGLFEDAFGNDSITSQYFFKAMAQFTGMLISARSKFDLYEQGKASFTTAEKNGLQLFRQKCEGCHQEPLFTDFSYRNNGIDSMFADSGRAKITFVPDDLGKFKVPSLRNIELTFPYMHDGRYEKLDDVISHYRNGIKYAANLDTLLLQSIPMTDEEQSDIIAFLKTLSDHNFTSDTRFGKPAP